jgi:hypothetical protein
MIMSASSSRPGWSRAYSTPAAGQRERLDNADWRAAYAFAAVFRFAVQYRLMRWLSAFRCAADIRRRRRCRAICFRSRRAPCAKMKVIGSSSWSNESRRCGNKSMRYFASCTNSPSRASAPRLASSSRWVSSLRRGMLSLEFRDCSLHVSSMAATARLALSPIAQSWPPNPTVATEGDSWPVIYRSRCSISMGNGKMIVEFFSAAISVNV